VRRGVSWEDASSGVGGSGVCSRRLFAVVRQLIEKHNMIAAIVDCTSNNTRGPDIASHSISIVGLGIRNATPIRPLVQSVEECHPSRLLPILHI
jgi:hypothetical protein